MTRDEALDLVCDAIRRIVPDADFGTVGLDEPFRDALELDSLDFLTLVETLTKRTGVRIDEDDYPKLTTLSTCADFLVSQVG
ncbi:MAG TPA: acyl carrier protein [Actinospica sp.]|nr:acyl carrier protein [Actinospica sp.]